MSNRVSSSATAILRIRCADQRGLVSAVTQFIREHNGNLLFLDQHVDPIQKVFLMRSEWALGDFALDRDALRTAFAELATSLDMKWDLDFSDEATPTAIFVSKQGHCLYDLLERYESGTLNADVRLIVSNHEFHREAAERYGLPFHHFPITAKTKEKQETAELELLAEHGIQLVVMARYMQILSDRFISAHPGRVINIHHSSLPAFAGARPYHSAHERGVKLIGATAHYATQDLDEGPIIAQDVLPVTHCDAVADLVRRGRDVEKTVLARAVYLHLQHRVIVYGNKTAVFA